jgi:hypothetical protein
LATRSTDVADLGKCPGAWLLKLIYEDQQAEASYFALGSALHDGIDTTIKEDLSLAQALALVEGQIEDWIAGLDPAARILESSSRGVDTILDDAQRMMKNWFTFVHPSSDKRLDVYKQYDWPPRTEVAWEREDPDTTYPVWGSIDAIFDKKDSTEVAIVDWKSGTSRQRNSDQLHFYQFGYGYMPGDLAWFHHLDRVRKHYVIQEAEPYPGDAAVRQRVLATEAIKQSILEDGRATFNQDWYCNYCSVQEFCPVEGADKAGNLVNLERMVQYLRPMEQIEREVA